MKKKLLFAFGVWSLFWFALVMIVLLPFFFGSDLFKKPKNSTVFLWVSKVWIKIWLLFSFSRMKVFGIKDLPKDERFIFIYNHNSFLDVPMSCPFSPTPNKTIGKIEMMKIPIFKWVYKRGAIIIDRKQTDSRIQSYNAMKANLEQGLHVCIYPEGTRNKTSEPLTPFRAGAFRLAVETQTKIVPVIITGTRKSLPSGSIHFKPGLFTMTFLNPIEVANKNADQLMEESFNVMHKAYAPYFYKNFPEYNNMAK
jgi:1-acyl-sn-glycerol-3-phosphate acyltransferase